MTQSKSSLVSASKQKHKSSAAQGSKVALSDEVAAQRLATSRKTGTDDRSAGQAVQGQETNAEALRALSAHSALVRLMREGAQDARSLARVALPMCETDFLNLCEERALVGKCGNPLCPHAHQAQPPLERTDIDRDTHQIVRVRVDRHWCSSGCQLKCVHFARRLGNAVHRLDVLRKLQDGLDGERQGPSIISHGPTASRPSRTDLRRNVLLDRVLERSTPACGDSTPAGQSTAAARTADKATPAERDAAGAAEQPPGPPCKDARGPAEPQRGPDEAAAAGSSSSDASRGAGLSARSSVQTPGCPGDNAAEQPHNSSPHEDSAGEQLESRDRSVPAAEAALAPTEAAGLDCKSSPSVQGARAAERVKAAPSAAPYCIAQARGAGDDSAAPRQSLALESGDVDSSAEVEVEPLEASSRVTEQQDSASRAVADRAATRLLEQAEPGTTAGSQEDEAEVVAPDGGPGASSEAQVQRDRNTTQSTASASDARHPLQLSAMSLPGPALSQPGYSTVKGKFRPRAPKSGPPGPPTNGVFTPSQPGPETHEPTPEEAPKPKAPRRRVSFGLRSVKSFHHDDEPAEVSRTGISEERCVSPLAHSETSLSRLEAPGLSDGADAMNGRAPKDSESHDADSEDGTDDSDVEVTPVLVFQAGGTDDDVGGLHGSAASLAVSTTRDVAITDAELAALRDDLRARIADTSDATDRGDDERGDSDASSSEGAEKAAEKEVFRPPRKRGARQRERLTTSEDVSLDRDEVRRLNQQAVADAFRYYLAPEAGGVGLPLNLGGFHDVVTNAHTSPASQKSDQQAVQRQPVSSGHDRDGDDDDGDRDDNSGSPTSLSSLASDELAAWHDEVFGGHQARIAEGAAPRNVSSGDTVAVAAREGEDVSGLDVAEGFFDSGAAPRPALSTFGIVWRLLGAWVCRDTIQHVHLQGQEGEGRTTDAHIAQVQQALLSKLLARLPGLHQALGLQASQSDVAAALADVVHTLNIASALPSLADDVLDVFLLTLLASVAKHRLAACRSQLFEDNCELDQVLTERGVSRDLFKCLVDCLVDPQG